MADPTLVAGVRARAGLATTQEDTDYMDEILLLERWKNPLTMVSKAIGTYQSDTIDHHWWEDQLVPYHSQINYGTGYSSSATSVVVDDVTPFVPGDLVRNLTTDEVVLVTAVVDASNAMTIVREYGQGEGWTTTAAAITDNDYLERIGPAYEQGHPIPESVTTKPVDVKNYCQDMRTSFSFTEVVQDTSQRGEQDATLQERKKAIEHAEKIEMVNFWGMPYAGDKGAYVAATGNTLPTTAGGINYFLVNENNSDLLKDETELTMSEFEEYLEHVFAVGSREKFMYCPPRLLTGLEKWGITKMTTYADQKILGMPIQTWKSPHGTLHFVAHDMLKARSSSLYHYCFALDMNLIDFITIKNGTTRLRSVGYEGNGGSTLTKKEYQTIQSIRLRQPTAHGRLRFKTVAAA